MPRRSGVPKRDVLPDPIYGSKVVTKVINQVMLYGKKKKVEKKIKSLEKDFKWHWNNLTNFV